MQALLFGSIGVVCDTSELQRHAFNQAFRDHGLDWEWDRLSYRSMLETAIGGQNRIKQYSEQVNLKLSDDEIQQLHSNKTKLFNKDLEEGKASIRPGVARLVREAYDNDVQLGFVTSTSLDNVQAIANAAGEEFMLQRFNSVVHKAKVSKTKPDPDAYEVCLEELSCEPSLAVAIEDTAVSAKAAVAAGIPCILTPNGNSNTKTGPGVLSSVNHLGDKNAPARLITGRDIASSGMVTLDALRALTTGHRAVS